MTHPPSSDQPEAGQPSREDQSLRPPFPPAAASSGTANGSFADPLVPPGEGADPSGGSDDLNGRSEAGVKAAGQRSTRAAMWFLAAVVIVAIVLIIVIAGLSN